MPDVREIDAPSAYQAVLDGAVLLDVREPEELSSQAFAVPNSMHVPLAMVLDGSGLADVPHARTLVVACLGGWRSANAAAVLVKAGFDAVNLGGGWLAWVRAGLPAWEGEPADASTCGCGCGSDGASGSGAEIPVVEAGCGCYAAGDAPCC